MRRPATALFVILFALAGGFTGTAQAQTCTPPMVAQIGGTNPTCGGQPVTLDAGPGWATYLWSPGNATTRMLTDAPSSSTAYTVTVTDGNGCSVTSQPYLINTATPPAAPVIHTYQDDICPIGGYGSAYIDGPADGGQWSQVTWSAEHGTVYPNGYGGSVAMSASYSPDGSGQPVVLHVAVTDANFCTAEGTKTITIRSIEPPVLHTYQDDICPVGGYGSAYIDGPLDGGQWSQVTWSAEHGSVYPNSFGGSPAMSASYSPDGSGLPLVLHVAVTDSGYCTSSTSKTITIRSIPPPVLHTYQDDICPVGGYGSAYIDGPLDGGQWSQVTWSVEHGSVYPNSFGGYVATSASYSPDGSGLPVVLHVAVTDSGYCTNSTSKTIAIRTIAPPVLHTYQDDICPVGGYGSAYIDGPLDGGQWSQVTWSAEHGSVYPNSYGGYVATSASYSPDGSGLPLILHVAVTDAGYCTNSASKTIAIRTIVPPVMHTYQEEVCPNGYGSVYIDGPADGGQWAQVTWSAEHASIDPQTYGGGYAATSASYMADGSGLPVVLHAAVTDSGYCTAQAVKTLPVRVLTPPAITTLDGVCTGAYVTATVAPPPGDNTYPYPPPQWSSVQWSATGGTVVGTTVSSPTATFIAEGGPLTVMVTVTDSQGCSVTSSKTIPVTTNPPTAVITIPARVCAGSQFTVHVADPSGNQPYFSFRSSNATFNSSDAGGNATFTAGPAGAIDIWVTSSDSSAPCAVYGHVTTISVAPPSSVAVTPSGSTSLCPGGSVTLTAPAGMDSYSWSNGATTQAITVVAAGAYSVTASTAPGCSATSAPVNVTMGAPATPSLSLTYPTVCNDGTDRVTVDNASSFTGITWTTSGGSVVMNAGDNSWALIEAYPSGTQVTATMHATDAGSGCPVSGSVTIPVVNPAPPVMTVSNMNACYDELVTVSIPAQAPGTQIYWTVLDNAVITSGGNNQTSIVVRAPANNFRVKVGTSSQAQGCYVENQTTINAHFVPPAQLTSDATSGFGCPGSERIVTLTNAAAYTSFSWSVTNGTIVGPSDQPTIHVVIGANGTTTIVAVTATDNGICTTHNSVNIFAIQPNISIGGAAPGTTYCQGSTATLTADSSSPNLTYVWSTGATTPTINVTTPGPYTVTATNAIGCSTTSAPVTVNFAVGDVDVNVSGATTFCRGGSVTLTAMQSGPGVTYAWSNGATTQAISATETGDYSVQVVGFANCHSVSRTIHVQVGGADKPAITAGGPTTFCAGGSVALTAHASGGVAPYSYQWMHVGQPVAGATSQTYVAAPAGNDYFYVVVTDALGCVSTTSDAVILTVNPLPTASVTAPSRVCAGGVASASAPDAGAGGTYAWSITNGTIDSTMSGAVFFHAGNSGTMTLNVTVTTAAGCSASASGSLAIDPLPSATITPSGPTTFCSGGSVTLTAPLADSYVWSPNGETTRSIAVSSSGNYSVAVTTNGCSATGAATAVTVNALPDITFSTPTRVCGTSESAQEVQPSPGMHYVWSISGGAITQQAEHRVYFTASAGSSEVVLTVTGTSLATGCSKSGTIHLPVNALPTVAITPVGGTAVCAGSTVTLNATAGMASYLWSPGGATTSSISATPGTYTVTATNAAGCSATSAPVTVSNFTTPAASVTGGSGYYCSGTSATLTASLTGTAPWSITWSDGVTQSGIATATVSRSVTPSTLTTYTITAVSDAHCSGTASGSADVHPTAAVSATVTGSANICPGGNATITAFVSGIAPWRVTWSDGVVQTFSSGNAVRTVSPSSTTTYTVTSVTDGSTCTVPGNSAGSAVITVSTPPPTPAITAGGVTTFCQGGSVTLQAPAGYTYLWSPGNATTQSITVSTSGNYTVRVTNACGLSATSAVTAVTVNPTPVITAFGPTSQTVKFNKVPQTLSVTATGSGITYQWLKSGVAISGATSSQYVPPTSVRGTFTYSVRVKIGSCSVDSANATVVVN
jgi:hypothetical protein